MNVELKTFDRKYNGEKIAHEMKIEKIDYEIVEAL